MDGFQAGICSLLQDISSNSRDNAQEQDVCPVPFSRLTTSTQPFQIVSYQNPEQTTVSAFHHHQLPSALPFRSPGTFHNNIHENVNLDEFGKPAALNLENITLKIV